MLKIEQYNSFFSIYIYLLLIIPIMFLGLVGKKSKILNLFISLIMVSLLLSPLSLQMWEAFAFLVFQIVLILVYYF